MADPLEQELLNFEEVAEQTDVKKDQKVKGHYVGVHSTGFRDFLLSPELNQAIGDCGFEHPSQVQQECIPQAVLSRDIICQGKSGMGKTAVFVISVLQQLDPVEGEVSCLVLAPTRELAYQICKEFERFSKYMQNVTPRVLFGGIDKRTQRECLKTDKPNIIVACPGRCLEFVREKYLDLSKVKFFIIDEADKVLEQEDMKKDVESICKALPQDKQTMLFSATMPEEMKKECRKLTRDAIEVFVDDDTKLTLHGLQQFYVKLAEAQKNRKLTEILDNFKFNQLVIFVSEVSRAKKLCDLLNECGYPTICIHRKMQQAERIKVLREFKDFKKKILVATDVFARGIDVERVNIVVNYDMPKDSSDTYLHRVGRAGRFGTKGLAVSFISSEEDVNMLQQIQSRFEVAIPELTGMVEADTYMNA